MQSLSIDGKKVEVEVVAYDTSWEPVTLTAVHEIITQPSWMDTLKFIVLVGVVVYVGIYAGFVMVLWGRDKWQHRETKDTEDTRNRLSELGRLAGVMLLTLFGGSADFGQRPARPPVAGVSSATPPVSDIGDDTPPAPSAVDRPSPAQEKKKEIPPPSL
jgi:hypothetical protein